MKPANFPERKRQRQIRALERIKGFTAKGDSNVRIIRKLTAAVATSQRDKRSKICRTDRGLFSRA